MRVDRLLLLVPAVLAITTAAALAGPLEARRLYDAAKTRRNAPWPEAVGAYRKVLFEAGKADSIRPRALKAIASIYERAGLPHGALAARHTASRAGRRSDSLASLQLACARSLSTEGDLDAARTVLLEVAAFGSSKAPGETATALRLLAEEADDRRDRARLRALLRRMDAERVPYPLRIETRGRLGMLQLEDGARLQAERSLADARRLFAESQSRADEDTARRAVKVWLDLPLRKALAR